ncbi:hypothetical protein WCN91_10590 [Pseudoalteromonas sp. YIC-827]|uniref:DUF11 domain-containing protein n=1 Tax=Pseudoalteromonas qingdaonensis TaxID=3131913 RepID=A0ABU9MX54_9GAMM
MKRFNCKQLVRAMGVALISTASLYGISTTPAHASFFPQQMEEACMAEQAGFNLNCTANDVRVSKVDNIQNVDPDDGPRVECTIGELFEFKADVTITTTANERYDYSVYLPEGDWSAQEFNTDNTCSILIGETNGPGVDLEEGQDQCADISKARGYSDTHVYGGEIITMYCRDEDNSGKAEFDYCMAWHNKDGDDCSEANPAAPGTPSKCRCDSFDIDIFIKPDPVVINKTLLSSSTHTEPGGTYTFELSFTNSNANSSIYIQSLEDLVDEGANGSYETTLDLWGATGAAGSADGVYLTSSNCEQPADGGKIAPSDTYSCQFTVHIVDRDLPDDQSPELYDDVVRVLLWDEKDDPVSDDQCPATISDSDGQDCSDVKRVNVTNLPPSIEVTKTASPDTVPESGANVTYTIRVENTSDDWDSPVTLTYLEDDMFGPLGGKGSCALFVEIENTLAYECSFVEFISAAGAGSHVNVATAKAIDDEGDEAQNSGEATVMITDIPSDIYLVKTANPDEVLETGDDPTAERDVDYTFEFGVDAAGVDTVEFMSLTDTRFGDITGDCSVNMYNDGDDTNGTVGFQPITPVPLNGFDLDPGESASCTIIRGIQGTPSTPHTNTATITGEDDDGQPVEAMDSETVNFTPADPAADMAFATSSLIVIELTNTGIRNVNLTTLTVEDASVFTEQLGANFKLLNEGGDFNNESYPACNLNQLLEYAGSGNESYACAFTIEWAPGLENTDPINAALNEIFVQVTDTLGQTSGNNVVLTVQAAENP